jgi:hypothetical protein
MEKFGVYVDWNTVRSHLSTLKADPRVRWAMGVAVLLLLYFLFTRGSGSTPSTPPIYVAGAVAPAAVETLQFTVASEATVGADRYANSQASYKTPGNQSLLIKGGATLPSLVGKTVSGTGPVSIDKYGNKRITTPVSGVVVK